MTRKQLTKILRSHYSESMVKKINTNKTKPSYEKMCLLKENYAIPLDAWQDIRAWIIKQENKRLQKFQKAKK